MGNKMQYVWNNGETKLVSEGYQNWSPGQPDHNSSNKDETCMEMLPGNGKWNDLSCHMKRQGYVY